MHKQLILVKGVPYLYRDFDVCWIIWRLQLDSPEYFVDKDFKRCTCGSWKQHGSCKHVDVLKEVHGVRVRPPIDPKRGR